MRHSTSSFFMGERDNDTVRLSDDGEGFGWNATFTIGPVTIFLRNQLQVFELIQSINEAYDRYLIMKPGGPF